MYETPRIQCKGDLAPILDQALNEIPNSLSAADWRVRRLLAFIDSQQGKVGSNLDHICRQLELGVSGPHAARLFKHNTGIGIRDYAKTRRLRVAAEKLKGTIQPVKEIAADLGYRTPTDLDRQFKHSFHITPSEFRSVFRQIFKSSRAV